MSAQLARLRAALRYSAGADRRALLAMILEIECGANQPTGGARPSEGCQRPPARRVDAERTAHPPVDAKEYPEERSGTARKAPSTF